MSKRMILAISAAAVLVAAIAVFIAVRSGSSGSAGGTDPSGKQSEAQLVSRLRDGDMNAVREYIEDEKARKNLKSIVDRFEKELQFPQYSRPIDSSSYDLLNPYVFIPVQRPFPENAKLSYDLVLPRQVMFRGETIDVTLRVMNNGEAVPAVHSAKAVLFDEERGHKTVTSFDLKPGQSSDKMRVFSGSYLPPQGIDLGNFCAVAVTFNTEGYGSLTASAMFTYANPVARVINIGTTKVEGPHLVIPVILKTEKPGDYRVTANLYASGEPIINAFGVSHISGGEAAVDIRIHASALREKGNPGPYVIKDFTVDRLPTSEEAMLYGTGVDKEFSIPKRSLKEYSSEKYENADEKRKLEQLKLFLGE